jgi:uncharacterized protein DUF4339
MPGTLYTIRTRDGLEVGPLSIEEVAKLAQEGQFSSTAMIYRSDTKRWHLAASIPEIRVILRKYNPRRDSHISRLRQTVGEDARDSRSFSFKVKAASTIYGKIKKTGIFHKIFPFLKK